EATNTCDSACPTAVPSPLLARSGAGLVRVTQREPSILATWPQVATHREDLMKFRAVLMSAALTALVLPAAAQDKTFQLKLSHWVPATPPLQKAMEEWGASVEKASNGTIKSTVFPAQQLGKAFDHYNMARDGIVEFAYVNPGYEPGRFPIIAAGEIPFL